MAKKPQHASVHDYCWWYEPAGVNDRNTSVGSHPTNEDIREILKRVDRQQVLNIRAREIELWSNFLSDPANLRTADMTGTDLVSIYSPYDLDHAKYKGKSYGPSFVCANLTVNDKDEFRRGISVTNLFRPDIRHSDGLDDDWVNLKASKAITNGWHGRHRVATPFSLTINNDVPLSTAICEQNIFMLGDRFSATGVDEPSSLSYKTLLKNQMYHEGMATQLKYNSMLPFNSCRKQPVALSSVTTIERQAVLINGTVLSSWLNPDVHSYHLDDAVPGRDRVVYSPIASENYQLKEINAFTIGENGYIGIVSELEKEHRIKVITWPMSLLKKIKDGDIAEIDDVKNQLMNFYIIQSSVRSYTHGGKTTTANIALLPKAYWDELRAKYNEQVYVQLLPMNVTDDPENPLFYPNTLIGVEYARRIIGSEFRHTPPLDAEMDVLRMVYNGFLASDNLDNSFMVALCMMKEEEFVLSTDSIPPHMKYTLSDESVATDFYSIPSKNSGVQIVSNCDPSPGFCRKLSTPAPKSNPVINVNSAKCIGQYTDGTKYIFELDVYAPDFKWIYIKITIDNGAPTWVRKTPFNGKVLIVSKAGPKKGNGTYTFGASSMKNGATGSTQTLTKLYNYPTSSYINAIEAKILRDDLTYYFEPNKDYIYGRKFPGGIEKPYVPPPDLTMPQFTSGTHDAYDLVVQNKAFILKQIDDKIKAGVSVNGGDFNSVDISSCTDMRDLFYHGAEHAKPYPWVKDFNGNIGRWNVSNVTTMGNMFWECSKFNQDLNNWNVSNVAFMNEMFRGCTNFNKPLNKWNVSNVTHMHGMFMGCSNFNQNIGNWKVTKLTDMRDMFNGCGKFRQNINSWPLSKAATMAGAFNGCPTKPSWIRDY